MMYPVHHMMDRGVHHMMDGVHHMMDGYLFSTNLLYLWFLIAQELKNLNSIGAVKLFFQYLILSPSYSCYRMMDRCRHHMMDGVFYMMDASWMVQKVIVLIVYTWHLCHQGVPP